MPIKNCITCDIEMGECHHLKKYCADCKILRRKELRNRDRTISKNEALIEIDTTGEEFKTVNGFENYEISNCGRVWSKKSNKFLKLMIKIGGYVMVNLYKTNYKTPVYVHRLVALHFIENPNNYKLIDHIDRVKSNNHIENLQWATYKMNGNNRITVINRKGSVHKLNRGKKRFCVHYYNKDLTNKQKYYKCFYTEEEAKEFLNNVN